MADYSPESPSTPPMLSPSTLPEAEVPEVSLVEEEATTGVTFTPEYVEALIGYQTVE